MLVVLEKLMRRWIRILALGLVTALTLTGASPASATLIGENVDVTLQEPGFPDAVDTYAVTVISGIEITEGDGSVIGDLLLGGEFFDFDAFSIVYNVRGDGPDHATPGFQTTGFDPLAQYVFDSISNFVITDVTVMTSANVIGVALGSEVFFDAASITLLIGTLGVQETPGIDLGQITLTIEFAPNVPEPGVWALVLLGFGALLFRRQAA